MATSLLCDLAHAAFSIANLTDVCDSFVRCVAFLQLRISDCPWNEPLGLDAAVRVQMAYGMFREVFEELQIPGSNGQPQPELISRSGHPGRDKKLKKEHSPKPKPSALPELPFEEVFPWAMTTRADGCGRRIDLVIQRSSGAQAAELPLLGPLLSRSPTGACIRVVVYERPHAGVSTKGAAIRVSSSFDARDVLFSVQRVLQPAGLAGLADLVLFHRDHGASQLRASPLSPPRLHGRPSGAAVAAAATTTVFLSSPFALSPDGRVNERSVGVSGVGAGSSGSSQAHPLNAWCHARALFSDQFGPPAIAAIAGSGMVLRYSASDLAVVTRASVDEALRRAIPLEAMCSKRRHYSNTIAGAQAQQRLLRAMAMLLVLVAREIEGDHMNSSADVGGGPRLRTPEDALPTPPQPSPSRLSTAETPPQMVAVALAVSTFGVTLGRTRPPLAYAAAPLACLDAEFTRFNRELYFEGASAARAACEPATIARAAATTRAFLEHIAASQNDSLHGAKRKCAPRRLVAVRPHPSGFFSLLHGLVKPLTHTLRTGQVLLTPRVLEFTGSRRTATAGPPCTQRDLSCFFEPLAPLCDAAEREGGARAHAKRIASDPGGSNGHAQNRNRYDKPTPWPTIAREVRRARDFIRTVSRRLGAASMGVPRAFEARGWFWWTSQLLSYLMRPNAVLAASVEAALQTTGLGAALDSGRLVIGMHVRHGDACNPDEMLRARRSCTPLVSYMEAARRLVASRLPLDSPSAEGLRWRKRRSRKDRPGPENAAAAASDRVDPSRVTIYLATDSAEVIKEAQSYADEFELVHLSSASLAARGSTTLNNIREVMRHDPQKGKAILWDRRVYDRFFWGQSDWTQQQAFDATLEALLLARADAFVGKLSSNLFRAAFSLRAAHCDCQPAFISLDAPWCFDYGLREGRNWEFPMLNASLGRLRTDALFEC